MEYRNGQAQWWTPILVIVAFVVCGSAALLLDRTDPREQLNRAQARWSTRPFSHYRLQIETSPTCHSDVEVRNNDVVSLFNPASCGASNQTIDTMFDLVKRNRPIIQRCTFYKCACSQTITVYATYDEQWGYPRRIAVWLRRDINWTARDLWQFVWEFWKLPACRRTADENIFGSISLEPLP